MGTDKASLSIGGRTLLERAAAELASVASEVVLACGSSERYAQLGFPLAIDRIQDAGPLAGIEAGMARSRTAWTAVLACDMPRTEAGVFRALFERAVALELDACLLETEKGVEPLCAIYRQSCLALFRTALDAGVRKITSAFVPPLRIGSLAERDLPARLAYLGVAENVNTPEELDRVGRCGVRA